MDEQFDRMELRTWAQETLKRLTDEVLVILLGDA